MSPAGGGVGLENRRDLLYLVEFSCTYLDDQVIGLVIGGPLSAAGPRSRRGVTFIPKRIRSRWRMADIGKVPREIRWEME
jgi:hypothetical protein